MMESLLKNGLDPIVTHDLGDIGMTMYQIKIDAVADFYAN